MLRIFTYFNVFCFPPWEKSAMQQMQANSKHWNTKQWRQQVPLPKTQTDKQKKESQAKHAKKLQGNFYYYLVNDKVPS